MNDHLTICSDRLTAQVVVPGSAAYGRARFNWNCFVDSLVLDGKYQLAEPEQRIASRYSSGGAGLCSEYIQANVQEETPIGEKWPHMGSGYLIREQDPFHFSKTYAVDPFATTYKASENAVDFTTEAVLCQGYAYREEKSVRVESNTITISTTLKNTGGKPIIAQEYNHNFLSINGEPVGPHYKLLLPQFMNVESIAEGGCLVGGKDYLTWSGAPADKNRFYNRLDHVNPVKAPYTWMLVHENVPITIRENDDFIPLRAAVWGVEHCICAEIFIDIHVEPGQIKTWNRTWTLDRLAE